MGNSDALSALRRHTATAHADLERSDFILPSTKNRTTYARLIGAMLSFQTAIEQEFRRFEAVLAARGLHMKERYKADLLHAESLDLDSPCVDRPVLRFPSVSHAAGGVYVMEGSTLGGTVIAKSILTHLNHVSRYYGCYGRDTHQRWRSTSQLLNEFAENDREVAAMVGGAVATFSALRRHLALHLQ